jgi:cysteine desulfurase
VDVSRLPIYLDYHATTPLDRRVLERMLPFFTERFGNPASSSHSFGWQAQEAVEQARREVAGLISAASRDMIFTSGATESNNLALRGVAELAGAGRRRVVVSAIEHKSVLESASRLERDGWTVVVAPVDPDGRVSLGALREAVTPDTALVSVMAANNEIGVVQPIAEACAIAHAAGAAFHTDAAQAVGKIPIDVAALDVDLLSLTAHKMYGPKGCGALFCRRGISLAPLICGGGQERGVRSGTLNVPGIVGLGAACAMARQEMPQESARLRGLRDRLLDGLRSRIDGVSVNGSLEHRLPHNLHVSFAGIDAESLVIGIGDIAVSTGSACSSASATPSHVLRAIHDEAAASAASIRFGLGRQTTEEEIDYAIEKFTTVIQHLHANAPAH